SAPAPARRRSGPAKRTIPEQSGGDSGPARRGKQARAGASWRFSAMSHIGRRRARQAHPGLANGNDNGKPGHNGARRRSPRRHFDHGVCLAALRGITGGKLCVQDGMTVKAAAAASGSCPPYVMAAIALLQGDNTTLIDEALSGRVGLLEAERRGEEGAGPDAAYPKGNGGAQIAVRRALGPHA